MAVESRGRGLTESKLVLVRGARQLVTLRGMPRARRGAEMSALSVIPDGAVLINSSGTIEEVGPTRRIERLKAARDAVEVDATGLLALPAFVDSVVRPVFGHAAGSGFRNGAWTFEAGRRGVSEENGLAVLAGMVRHGTLAAEVLTGYGGDSAGELRLMRLYAALNGRVTNNVTSVSLSGYVGDGYRGNGIEWTRNVAIPLLESAAFLRMVQSATVTIGGEGAGIDEAREFLWSAQTHGLPANVHAWPGYSEAAGALTLASDARAVIGLEGQLTSLRGALARSLAVLTMTPAVTFGQDRDAFAPARKLIDEGAAIALGTNFGRETNGNPSMLHTMELACRYLGLSAEEAVTAATINAAYSVGCARDCGSIEPGKRGDLVLFDCEDLVEMIRNAAVVQVSRVVRGGRTVYRRGRVEGQI